MVKEQERNKLERRNESQSFSKKEIGTKKEEIEEECPAIMIEQNYLEIHDEEK